MRDAGTDGPRPRHRDHLGLHRGRRQAQAAGDTRRFESVSVRYVISLAERAVPEWQATLGALQKLPAIGAEAPVGYGVPLTAIEPRITAAIFGGGLFVHEALMEAARGITVPVQFLLPWDDEHVDRQSALALFDAFASREKTLHANPGDHRTIRAGRPGRLHRMRPPVIIAAGAPDGRPGPPQPGLTAGPTPARRPGTRR